jgi:SulP family sulfate permease
MKLVHFSFRPKLFQALVGYDRTRLWRDVSAGITVAIVALPLAMAFAIASGVKPEAGIITAIISGFLISALGGSRVQIGGPAGAFIVIIYGIVEKYGLANLLIATMFAGLLMLMMGLLRLGTLIRYIPVPIVIGFTNGIAILIALSQLKDFFGLRISKMPGEFFSQIHTLAANAGTAQFASCALALSALLILFAWPRLFTKLKNTDSISDQGLFSRMLRLLGAIPPTMIVLVLATAAVSLFKLPLDTIGSRFGGVPQTLPNLIVPTFSWDLVKQLFAPTITIALLGAIESLLCARIADHLINDRHDPNQELMAQGIANIVTPFFGGLPATGTVARTFTSIRAGASSPVAGMIHAVVLLLIVLVAAPLAADVPLAALAAILLFVAYNMGEWREFRHLLHFSNYYRILLLSTFLLTVMVDLTVAIEVGIVLACLFFIARISSLTRIEALPSGLGGEALPQGVAAYRIYGSLFFGSADKLEALVEPGAAPLRILLLDLHQLISLDTSGMDALGELHKDLQLRGTQLILCGTNAQPLDLMRRTGFITRVGATNCLPDLLTALHALPTILAANSR